MEFISINGISKINRQRETLKKAELEELKSSIHEIGLINPITVIQTSVDETTNLPRYRLIAGERRLTAVTDLYATHHTPPWLLAFDGGLVPRGAIPATTIAIADLTGLLKAEFSENKHRVQLTWQEEARAITAIEDSMKERAEAEGRTYQRVELARELQAQAPANHPMSLGMARKTVTMATTVARAMETRPDLARASSYDQAYRILLKESLNTFESELARREITKARSSVRLWDLKHGDLRHLMTQMPDNEVDLICTDPPYGQDAHTEKYSAASSHDYDDSAAYAMDLAIFILQEGWRVTKKQANIFMFCNWKAFGTLLTASQQYGWTPWYHPIIWNKGPHGHSPWGRTGWRHDYEMMFHATKGQRGLHNGPHEDVMSIQRVGVVGRDHGAEKPFALMEHLVSIGSFPHDLVLDPCAGSGTTLEAAIAKHRRAIGFELSEAYYNSTMARLGVRSLELTARPLEPSERVKPTSLSDIILP